MIIPEKTIKRMDALSRKNRVFVDNLLRLIASEIKSGLPLDKTWFDCELPFYVGLNKGEIKISGKSSCDFKTVKEVLHPDDLNVITEFMREKRQKHAVTMRGFLGEIFNESTTSALN